jgi:formate dehydrogenase (coenzyme F420) alpha subunit
MKKAKTIIENGVVSTLCRQCNMRCGLNLRIANGKITGISGNKEHPQFSGGICARGGAAAELVYHPDRLIEPLKKMPDGSFSPISHEQAMDEITHKMRLLKERHGARAMAVWTGEAIGFLQQCDYARRFIRAFGSSHYTSADSICYSTRNIAYNTVHGYCSISPDFENAQLILLWGTNPAVSHPPFMRAITRAKKRGAKLIVIDPRRTKSARKADLSLRILPGTDGALAWGFANYLIGTGSYDKDFVDAHAIGFERFARYAKKFTPQFVSEQTGISTEQFLTAARWMAAQRPRVVNFIVIALEHHENAFNTIRGVACLRGLCGAVDVRGGEPWPEGMGGNDLSLDDDIVPGKEAPIGVNEYPLLYEFRKECHSMTVIDHMLEPENIPDPIRGLIVTGANPVLTNPNSKKVAQAFSNLDLLVSRDLFLTPTARLAHYVLPAASFLERSELHYHSHLQLVTLTQKVLEIPGVQDEYTFWRELAHRLGFGEEYFPWEDEEQVNKWILEPTQITIDELKKQPQGFLYKPYREKKFLVQPFQTASGKFEFASPSLKVLGYPELPEYEPPRYKVRPEREYPFILITGARNPLYQHTRYRNIKRFKAAFPDAEAEIHPLDAARLSIMDQQWVRISSPMGAIEIQAKIVDETDILPGVIQVSHGWEDANVNLLSDDERTDPVSGFPLLKAIAVKIEKVPD